MAKQKAKPWTYVTTANSETRRGETYDISIRDGIYKCACMAWVFSKETPKTCKHLKTYLGARVSEREEQHVRAVTSTGEELVFSRRAIAFGAIPR